MPLDPEVQAFLDLSGISQLVPVDTLTPQTARAQFETYAEARKQGAREFVEEVRDLVAAGPEGGIRIRVYRPRVEPPAPALIYFHGGGWVLGDLESHDHVCRGLANRIPCVVLSVDYRLAPEHKFPAAVDDSYAATQWIAASATELGIDPERIAVSGDSAGGNLAAVVAQLAKQQGGPKLIFQFLIYPATDMTMSLPSASADASTPVLTKAEMNWFIEHYLNHGEDRTNPLASPLLANDLSGLPAAFIITAECDPLRDEGEAYGQRLREAGTPCEVRRYPGMPHGFFSFNAGIAAAQRALADATNRLRAAFGGVQADFAPADVQLTL